MGVFDFIFGNKSVAAQEYIFPINNGTCPVDWSIERFAKLCCAIASVIPEENRSDVVYKVQASRKTRTVTMSIDVGPKRAVNMRKILPGYRYYEMCGWEGNENYLEGTFQYMYFPDDWDGRRIDECIIEVLRANGNGIKIVNHFQDSIVDSGLLGVIFHIE